MNVISELRDMVDLAKDKNTQGRGVFIMMCVVFFVLTPIIVISAIVSLIVVGGVMKFIPLIFAVAILAADVWLFIKATKANV